MSTRGVRRSVGTRSRRRALAAVLLAAAVLLLVGAHQVQVAEAWLQAALLRLGRLDALQVERNVLVVLGGQRVGLAITAGCSVGPLLATFLAGTAVVVWWREIPPGRVLRALTRLAVVLVVANQLRIAAIVLAMRFWGIDRGYEVAHVFVGSAITTVGFVLGVVLLARGLADRERTPA